MDPFLKVLEALISPSNLLQIFLAIHNPNPEPNRWALTPTWLNFLNRLGSWSSLIPQPVSIREADQIKISKKFDWGSKISEDRMTKFNISGRGRGQICHSIFSFFIFIYINLYFKLISNYLKIFHIFIYTYLCLRVLLEVLLEEENKRTISIYIHSLFHNQYFLMDVVLVWK